VKSAHSHQPEAMSGQGFRAWMPLFHLVQSVVLAALLMLGPGAQGGPAPDAGGSNALSAECREQLQMLKAEVAKDSDCRADSDCRVLLTPVVHGAACYAVNSQEGPPRLADRVQSAWLYCGPRAEPATGCERARCARGRCVLASKRGGQSEDAESFGESEPTAVIRSVGRTISPDGGGSSPLSPEDPLDGRSYRGFVPGGWLPALELARWCASHTREIPMRCRHLGYQLRWAFEDWSRPPRRLGHWDAGARDPRKGPWFLREPDAGHVDVWAELAALDETQLACLKEINERTFTILWDHGRGLCEDLRLLATTDAERAKGQLSLMLEVRRSLGKPVVPCSEELAKEWAPLPAAKAVDPEQCPGMPVGVWRFDVP
jgi:hypothetical protein